MPHGSVQWHGTQRRACGPGANWNVQVNQYLLMLHSKKSFIA